MNRTGLATGTRQRMEGARAAASPERIAELRRRVLSGAYGSAEMAGQVAQRILESGEL